MLARKPAQKISLRQILVSSKYLPNKECLAYLSTRPKAVVL